MDPLLLWDVLRIRRSLRRRDGWSRLQIERHRAARVAALRAHTLSRSPFYRRFHGGLENRPLQDLPVLTKAQLMASFDDLVTDRRIRLADARSHMDALGGDDRYLGRYVVGATSGASGHPGLFLWDRIEWATVIASFARATDWAGLRLEPFRRVRTAVVSSRAMRHVSARVGLSVDSPFVPTLRLDATMPVSDLVTALNAFRPASLVAYASMLPILAREQVEGRLRIRPRFVFASSEVLPPDVRRRVWDAWGTWPFEVYAATETAGIASECEHHAMHLYEDLVVAESVDEAGNPVPEGEAGARLLVTVLFSRTQPLIRYALDDRVRLAPGECPCGRPFRLVASVEGRQEDVLQLAGNGGQLVPVHPNVFHDVLDALPLTGWQVIEEGDGLRVLLAGGDAAPADGVAELLGAALAAIGLPGIRVTVESVPAIPRTALGKAPLVRRADGGGATRGGQA
ncbi:MAG: phenylacetate--CoA ligase family protein [Candidatus Sericytochromatia bacterium]|nr:phenylacetate--CoA ligase family protein [Candidatus Tanganyikabacteria bacterium]